MDNKKLHPLVERKRAYLIKPILILAKNINQSLFSKVNINFQRKLTQGDMTFVTNSSPYIETKGSYAMLVNDDEQSPEGGRSFFWNISEHNSDRDFDKAPEF